MNQTTNEVARVVVLTRKAIGVTQKELALTSGTGIRFIVDLERGKPTCQIEKVLNVLNTLGIQMNLIPPASITMDKEK